SIETGLRPRPRICGKMNHIQCPILVPDSSSESTCLKTRSCAITKRSKLYGSPEGRTSEACIHSSLSMNLSTRREQSSTTKVHEGKPHFAFLSCCLSLVV